MKNLFSNIKKVLVENEAIATILSFISTISIHIVIFIACVIIAFSFPGVAEAAIEIAIVNLIYMSIYIAVLIILGYESSSSNKGTRVMKIFTPEFILIMFISICFAILLGFISLLLPETLIYCMCSFILTFVVPILFIISEKIINNMKLTN